MIHEFNGITSLTLAATHYVFTHSKGADDQVKCARSSSAGSTFGIALGCPKPPEDTSLDHLYIVDM